MKQFFSLLTVCLMLLSIPVRAQQKSGSIHGKAIDAKTNQPVEFASFAVKNVKDSTVAAMGVTTKEGVFTAKDLKPGQYKFYLALIGYKPILKLFEISSEKYSIDFSEIKLEEEAITLNSVLIKGDLLPMIIKKDTVEFNADAFKTQADASLEDALKTMPGMEVDKDGNISFNGKKIDKVLVEGKDFFGNDPKMATRNLPKEIINKIQVIEKKTDDAIFKGIDDGKRENVLNVTLKDDKKKGYFGNVGGGKGDAGLYDASFNINRFNNKRQFSLIGMANNINKSSFSFNDLSEFMGGDIFGSGMITEVAVSSGGMVVMSGGDMSFSFGGGSGGINDNKGMGLNYNDEWGKNPKYPNKINMNYMVNRNYGIQQSLSSKLNLLGADSYFNDNENNVTTTTMRHRLNMRLDIPIDSVNKLQISPNFGFSGNDNNKAANFNSYTENGAQNINRGNSLTANDSKSPSFGGRILFNHRFQKRGRSFSVTANGNYSRSALDGQNLSNVTIFNNGLPSNTLLDQLIDQSGSYNNYSILADFSEPLSKKITLGLGVSHSRREDLINRVVYDYNLGTTRYDLINSELSRNLENYNQNSGLSLRFNYMPSPKFNFTINTAQRIVNLEGKNLMNNKGVSENYILFEPNIYLSYKMSKVSSFNFSFYRFSNTPGVSQLQPLTDNSNPLQITMGNPNLRPSADNSGNLSYSWYDINKGTSLNFGMGFTRSEDRIIDNSTLDPKTGIQTTFYDNISGSYNISARVSGGFKIKKLNLSVNPNISTSLGKNKSFLNSAVVSSDTRSLGLGTSVNYALGSDLQLSNRINYNRRNVHYNYNNQPGQQFTTVSNSLSLNASLPYDMRFTLSSNAYYNANMVLGNNNTTHTAHVSMEKFFLKKTLSFKLSVSDVFDNSRNASRYASDTYILESVNLGMHRYVMFSLNYRLRKFGEKEKPANSVAMPMIIF